MAQEWFEPGISSLTDDYPEWLDNWDLFVDELQTNFGPFDKSTNVEDELTNLQMKDSQRISEYLVHFNSLAVCCLWGESALWYRFYEGLPGRLKDEICREDGKPNTLSELWKKAQNINAQHWERVQERSQEQNLCPPNQQKTQSSSSNNSFNNTSKPLSPTLVIIPSPLAQNPESRRKLQNPSQQNQTLPENWTLKESWLNRNDNDV